MAVHRAGAAQRGRLAVGAAQALERLAEARRAVEDRLGADVDDVGSHVGGQGVEPGLGVAHDDRRHEVVDPYAPAPRPRWSRRNTARSFAARSAGGPLRTQQGEAVGVALLAVDALPALQGRLAPEPGGLGRAGRGDVPRLDEEVHPGDGELLEGERGTAPATRARPVPDRGPAPPASSPPKLGRSRSPCNHSPIDPRPTAPAPTRSAITKEKPSPSMARWCWRSMNARARFVAVGARHRGDRGDQRVGRCRAHEVQVPEGVRPQHHRPATSGAARAAEAPARSRSNVSHRSAK